MTDLWLSGVFFPALNTPKLVFGWSSARDPAGRAYNAAPDHLVDTPSHLGASVISHPTQIPGYAYVQTRVISISDNITNNETLQGKLDSHGKK